MSPLINGSDAKKELSGIPFIQESVCPTDSLNFLDIKKLNESIRRTAKLSIFAPRRPADAVTCPDETPLQEARICCTTLFNALCKLCGDRARELDLELAKQESLPVMRTSKDIKAEIQSVQKKLSDTGAWAFISGKTKHLKRERARLHDEFSEVAENEKLRAVTLSKLMAQQQAFRSLVVRFGGDQRSVGTLSFENLVDEWQFVEEMLADHAACFQGFLEENAQLIGSARSLLKINPL